MEYVIASVQVTDEIQYADGTRKEKIAGGAGFYAMAGIRLWCDEVLPVTGVGADFAELYGEWYEKNQVSMKGLIVKGERTPHTKIQYFEDGEREEISLYGLEHFQNMEVTPEELRPYFRTAKGIYIFKNSSPKFWEKILEDKKGTQAKVMWEIACDATYYENLEPVRAIAREMDVFSINLTESKALLGKENLEDIIHEYQSWGIPLIFLRRGAKGAVMITPEAYVEVPSQPDVHVVDPTGGGNSSSGAVLYGFTEGYSPKICGQMGSLSAAMCLEQYGVPPLITDSMREEARKRLDVK
ncbi:MAG: carbohydrate kinase family protein [Blautia sp.]|jgi:sugar/nucleoside kinase (ribokinase family)